MIRQGTEGRRSVTSLIIGVQKKRKARSGRTSESKKKTRNPMQQEVRTASDSGFLVEKAVGRDYE